MEMQPLPPLDPLQRYTINETCAYLRKSRAGVYAEIKSGHLLALKDGRRTYVHGSEIARRSRIGGA